jgi:DNA-binding CsgD family transcriptional regulator
MAELQRIAETPLPPELLAAYDSVVGAVGGALFDRAAAAAIRSIIDVDRLYLFDIEGPNASRVLFSEHETAQRPTPHDLYVGKYLPLDPILVALEAANAADEMVLLRVGPQDIIQPGYRKALENADIVERISIVRRGEERWRCLNVARRTPKGRFTPDELDRLATFTRFLLPLIGRHEALTVSGAAFGLTVAQLEDRFWALQMGLSPREIEVSARAAYGMTVEGAALDLNIARATVLTYRKRAYQRLGVTSANELAKLVMR